MRAGPGPGAADGFRPAMALLDRLPTNVLTQRGWGFVIAGGAALLAAQILGRRDLLYVGVFLACLPALSVLMLRLIKPRFTIERSFAPSTMETGSTTTVSLAVASNGPPGPPVTMEEHVPPRFGRAPQFTFPSRNPTRDGVSLYEYRLRSSTRGLFDIGPVTAQFTDPFGLGTSRHLLGHPDPLVVTPAPLDLVAAPLSGSRGTDGTAATRRQANPSDDDVMTREYRHGDSMRRVHWAATARHNELMVRQEESVTTPEATLLMDQRQSSFSYGFNAVFGADSGHGAAGISTIPAFEWAVTAAVSISAHLLERSYALRFLDHHGAPALLRSPSAPFPGDEEFQGPGALAAIAEGLAALGPAHDSGRRSGSTAAGTGPARRPGQRRSGSSPAGPSEAVPPARGSRREDPHQLDPASPFGDDLLDRLASNRHRGPLIAVLGLLTPEEARSLATASGYGSVALALVVVDRPAEAAAQIDILRTAGWHAAAASPRADMPAVWAGLGHSAPTVPAGPRTSTPQEGLR
ncbi:DUF58 domain-containing protein [Arthrobacter crusticola]|nr:DUF58 domain-containing protein [Arthrobacter crusticola]